MDANLITKEELRKTQDSSQMNRERFEYICDAYIYMYIYIYACAQSFEFIERAYLCRGYFFNR
jgi:hypothetical protein